MAEPVRRVKAEMADYSAALLAEKRRHPGDDLTTVLRPGRGRRRPAGRRRRPAARGAAERVGRQHRQHHRAARSGPSPGGPRRGPRCVAEPDLLVDALEECGRFEPSIRHTIKYARHDTELLGRADPRGHVRHDPHRRRPARSGGLRAAPRARPAPPAAGAAAVVRRRSPLLPRCRPRPHGDPGDGGRAARAVVGGPGGRRCGHEPERGGHRVPPAPRTDGGPTVERAHRGGPGVGPPDPALVDRPVRHPHHHPRPRRATRCARPSTSTSASAGSRRRSTPPSSWPAPTSTTRR